MTERRPSVIAARDCHHDGESAPVDTLISLRAKQAETFQAHRLALKANGINSLDKQAKVLCLPRSTTWFVLQSNHKWRGLNAVQVVRILRSERLPEEARRVVMRYVYERVGGAYGHTEIMRQKFVMRLEKLGWVSAQQSDHPLSHPAT